MKVLKLTLGILCICLSVLIVFQSTMVGVGNSLQNNGEAGGSGGLMLSILVLTAGIVMIATRKSEGRGGSIAAMILYLLAALLGFSSAGSFADLKVYSTLCLILAGLNLVAAVFNHKPKKTERV